MAGFFLVLLIVFAVPILFLILLYNRLVLLKNRVSNAWHQIDVQLERRADLVPNLVETVKAYAAHEKGVFESVTQARSALVTAGSVHEKADASNQLTATLRSLFAVAEAYPQLKADQNFRLLQEELSGIEQKIAYSRQFYNDVVMQFNTAQQTFPANLIAGPLGFRPAEYFQIEEAEKRAVPKVSFS